MSTRPRISNQPVSSSPDNLDHPAALTLAKLLPMQTHRKQGSVDYTTKFYHIRFLRIGSFPAWYPTYVHRLFGQVSAI